MQIRGLVTGVVSHILKLKVIKVLEGIQRTVVGSEKIDWVESV